MDWLVGAWLLTSFLQQLYRKANRFQILSAAFTCTALLEEVVNSSSSCGKKSFWSALGADNCSSRTAWTHAVHHGIPQSWSNALFTLGRKAQGTRKAERWQLQMLPVWCTRAGLKFSQIHHCFGARRALRAEEAQECCGEAVLRHRKDVWRARDVDGSQGTPGP